LHFVSSVDAVLSSFCCDGFMDVYPLRKKYCY